MSLWHEKWCVIFVRKRYLVVVLIASWHVPTAGAVTDAIIYCHLQTLWMSHPRFGPSSHRGGDSSIITWYRPLGHVIITLLHARQKLFQVWLQVCFVKTKIAFRFSLFMEEDIHTISKATVSTSIKKAAQFDITVFSGNSAKIC